MCCRVRTCFCFLNLRQGCYLAVAYSMLMGGLATFHTVMKMRQVDLLFKEVQASKLTQTEQEMNQAKQGAKIVLYISLGLFAAWILTSLFIICGIKSRVRGFLLPWIVITAVIMGLSIYQVGLSLLNIRNVVKDISQMAELIVTTIMFLSNIYAIICVSAFYRNHLHLEEEEDIPEAVPMKGEAYYSADAV